MKNSFLIYILFPKLAENGNKLLVFTITFNKLQFYFLINLLLKIKYKNYPQYIVVNHQKYVNVNLLILV